MNNRTIIQIIKEKRKLCPLTNVYTLENAKQATDYWETERGLLFSYMDHGVSRLGFFASDADELLRLMDKVKSGDHYLEYITKDPENSGFSTLRCIARMKRMVNADCRSVFCSSSVLQYRDEAIGEIASVSEAHEINQLLWSVFRSEVSHLLWDEELAMCIEKRQITIHRSEMIDAILMVEEMPRKFYINQVVNKGEKKNIHAMLLNRLWNYSENGGRYIYAWVEECNIASMKFHGKYGLEHDGMWNMVWLLEK